MGEEKAGASACDAGVLQRKSARASEACTLHLISHGRGGDQALATRDEMPLGQRRRPWSQTGSLICPSSSTRCSTTIQTISQTKTTCASPARTTRISSIEGVCQRRDKSPLLQPPCTPPGTPFGVRKAPPRSCAIAFPRGQNAPSASLPNQSVRAIDMEIKEWSVSRRDWGNDCCSACRQAAESSQVETSVS